jgi:hypothetical protein
VSFHMRSWRIKTHVNKGKVTRSVFNIYNLVIIPREVEVMKRLIALITAFLFKTDEQQAQNQIVKPMFAKIQKPNFFRRRSL